MYKSCSVFFTDPTENPVLRLQKPHNSESDGIVSGGGYSFVSYAFPGGIVDKSLTVKNGLLHPDLWELKNDFMTNCGFTVEEYRSLLGVKLAITSFKEKVTF